MFENSENKDVHNIIFSVFSDFSAWGSILSNFTFVIQLATRRQKACLVFQTGNTNSKLLPKIAFLIGLTYVNTINRVSSISIIGVVNWTR